MILQHIYKPIFNFIYEKITYRIGEKPRNIILITCFFGIFAAQFLSQYIFEFEGFNRGIRDYLICFFFGIALIASADRKLEIIKWRKSIYVPYILAGVLILIASLDHEMGPAYQAFPIVMLTAFICMFYIWGNREDYGILFKCITIAYFVLCSILFIVSIIRYPYYDNILSTYTMDYAPFNANPNGVAKLFLPGIISGLYLASNSKKKKDEIFCLIATSAFTSMVILTKCRAAHIILILLAVCIIIGNLLLSFKKEKKKILWKGFLLIIIIIVLSASFSYAIMELSGPINDLIFAKNDIETNISSQEVEITQSADSEETDREEIIYARLSSVEQFVSENELLFKIDEFMSGRIKIWTVFIQHMSWRGESELLFVDTEYAHNQYIELSYKAGIPTGIIYFIFVASVGIHILINLFKKERRQPYLYFQLMIYCVFAVISMLDTGVLPFERAFIFMFYISAAPMFIKKENGPNKKPADN